MIATRAILLVLGALGTQALPQPQANGVSASGSAASAAPTTSASGAGSAATPSASATAITQPSASANGTAATSSVASVAPAVPSSAFDANMTVPGQDNIPPPQWWCNNGGDGAYCPGALLQDVQLAELFPDSKTFSDKPTLGSLNETMAAFNALGSNLTVGQVQEFVTKNFKPEGQELEAVAIQGFVENPQILDNITDPIYKAWVSKVNSYWELLIRQTNESALCQPGQCESSLIPLNHTIVVPGGRYREIYYWDSFWIMEGLLSSELYTYAWNLLQNMFDMVEEFGFIPNGGRKYYLNRSQPPVLAQMVAQYVRATGNVTVLERGLPLLHQELEWFQTNRTMLVTSPFTNVTHRVAHWNVKNSAPRPEGYVEDYTTANGGEVALNASQRADLYAELASGAESGWDYTSRWMKEPLLNKTDNNPTLRTLNIRAMVPVDLTALLAADHSTVASLYEMYADAQRNNTNGNSSTNLNPNSTNNATPSVFTACMGASSGGGAGSGSGSPGGGVAPSDGKCAVPVVVNNTKPTPDGDKVLYHRAMSANYTAAVTDLHWDPVKAFWYDFNTTSMTRSNVYTPAGLWPLWLNVTPPALLQNETLGLQIASGLRFLLGQYTGSPSVASLLDTGLNWDFPNVWPPHAYSTIKAMETLGRLLPRAQTLSQLATTNFSMVAPGQFGLNASELPEQPTSTLGNSTLMSNARSNSTSNSTSALPWPKALAVEIASRYMTAAFCSWYSTGGNLPGVLAQLPMAELNATGTYLGDEGHMFEKFNVTDIDAAGGGGEYTVVTGFGWTNGVVLWAAGQYGKYLPAPSCPQILITPTNGTTGSTGPASNGTTGSNSTSNTTELAPEAAMFEGHRQR